MFILGDSTRSLMFWFFWFCHARMPRCYRAKNREGKRKKFYKDLPDGYNVDPVLATSREALSEKRLELGGLGNNHVFNTSIPSHVAGRCWDSCAQQVVGIDAIQYYLPDVLEDWHRITRSKAFFSSGSEAR
jgi:hypothetical protein